MSSEQANSVPSSLEDRISKPTTSNGTEVAAESTGPDHAVTTGSWADEVASPVAAVAKTPPALDTETKAEESSSSMAQTDGAAEDLGGSHLQEPEYDVEVKLSDIQADPNNPLYSIKSFNELGLLVPPCLTVKLTLTYVYCQRGEHSQGNLPNEISTSFQNPRESVAAPTTKSPDQHDRTVSIRNWQNSRLCTQHSVSP